MADRSTVVIEASELVKQYEGVRALDGVTFEVAKGEIFALVGPNGAGKTTLLRLLTDILRPDSGRLTVLGASRLRDVLGYVGYLPEERGLYRSQSALDTVAYFTRLKGLGAAEARQAAECALAAVGMTDHSRRRVEELSKGMSQRVQLAAALAHRPELLILDEPFSGLDPLSARELQDLVRRQRDAGVTILLSTHNMEHAEKLCDRLLMLHKGKVRLYGTVSEIREANSSPTVELEFTGELPPLAGTCAIPAGEQTVRIELSGEAERRELLSRLLAAGVDVVRFEQVTPSLEEIFIQTAGADAAEALSATRAAYAG